MKQHRILSEGAKIDNTFGPVKSETQVEALMLHVSSAPTTSEYLTVTLDSAAGAAYDTVLYRIDLSAASTTDVFWRESFTLHPGDALRTAYTNTDGRTIGVTFDMR